MSHLLSLPPSFPLYVLSRWDQHYKPMYPEYVPVSETLKTDHWTCAYRGPYFKDYFDQPTRAQIGTIVAILEIGALISSLCVGRIGDLIGRRRTILYASVVFFVGGALQASATGIPMMIAGRVIAGLGVGALSTIVPVYQSEISPPHNRGKLACIEFTGNISGYAASVWVDYFCSYIKSDISWRLPLTLQCAMGALLGAGSLIICESPRWLLDNDHDNEGLLVIANLYGGGDVTNEKARQEYREIKWDVLVQRQAGQRSYLEMFRRYFKRVFIAMSAQAMAQLNGINVISYYAPLVFESAGWAGRSAILMTGINGLSYLASTVPPWYIVDRWGRRPILLSGAVAMIIALSVMAYFIFLDVPATPILTVLCVMIYNAAFGASWGPIPWLYPPEILPLAIRAKGASLSTASNWAFNYLVGEVTPVLQAAIKWRLYLMHAGFCLLSFFIVYFFFPETSGVRLEDMDVLFGDSPSAVPTPSMSTSNASERGALIQHALEPALPGPSSAGTFAPTRGSPVPSLTLDINSPSPRPLPPGSALAGASRVDPGDTSQYTIEPPTLDPGNGVRNARTTGRGNGTGAGTVTDQDNDGPTGENGNTGTLGGWISSLFKRRGGRRSKYTPLPGGDAEAQ